MTPPARTRAGTVSGIALVALTLATFAGCKVTALAPTEADRNRERVQELEREVVTLRGRVGELESALSTASSWRGPDALDPEILATAPFAESMSFGRFGGFVDLDGDGAADLIRLSLEPVDGRGRAVQVAGRARIEATAVPVGGTPQRIAFIEIEPAEWRERYRTGLFGASYAIELPLERSGGADALDANAPAAPVVVVAELSDGITRRTLRAERVLDPALASGRVSGRPAAPDEIDSGIR